MAIPVITGGNGEPLHPADKKTGEIGTAFTYSISASNSPTSYALASGTLPNGISLNTSSGVVSGTPTAGSTGTTTVTFTASNADGPSLPLSFKFFISEHLAPAITSALYIPCDAGAAFSYTITATNTPTLFTAVTYLTSLGLSLNTSTGVIDGTLPSGNDTTILITVRASNTLNGTNTQLTLIITGDGGGGGGGDVPVVNAPFEDDAAVGTLYSHTFTATNSPTSWQIQGLPPSFTADLVAGSFSGTPPITGDLPLVVRGRNGDGDGPTANFILHITEGGGGIDVPPVINSSLTATGQLGKVVNYTITATNAPTSFDANPTDMTIPPDKFTLPDANGRFRTTVNSAAGTYHIDITARNDAGSDTKTLVLTIAEGSGGGGGGGGSVNPGEGVFTEFNVFAEVIKTPCTVPSDLPPPSDLPDPPTNLKVVTPGVPGSGTATATWDPPING